MRINVNVAFIKRCKNICKHLGSKSWVGFVPRDIVASFVMIIYIRLNCSFSPLTFSKLRFWPPKEKKLQNNPLSFALVAVLAPKVDIDSVYADVAP